MPTQDQFIEALWAHFQQARFKGLEWKFIEWVRDPLCKTLGITKAQFNEFLEQALEDSDEGRIQWDIMVDDEVGPIREAQMRRRTPVVVCGLRQYLIYMKPIEPDKIYIGNGSSSSGAE